jgi:hypothetical protein
MMVPAKVGGTIPIYVIFDTGAGLDALAPSLIQRLGGKPMGQYTAFRMSGLRRAFSMALWPATSRPFWPGNGSAIVWCLSAQDDGKQQLGQFSEAVHPNNSIRAGFGTCRQVAGGNCDSEIIQNVLECNLHEAKD